MKTDTKLVLFGFLVSFVAALMLNRVEVEILPISSRLGIVLSTVGFYLMGVATGAGRDRNFKTISTDK